MSIKTVFLSSPHVTRCRPSLLNCRDLTGLSRDLTFTNTLQLSGWEYILITISASHGCGKQYYNSKGRQKSSTKIRHAWLGSATIVKLVKSVASISPIVSAM